MVGMLRLAAWLSAIGGIVAFFVLFVVLFPDIGRLSLVPAVSALLSGLLSALVFAAIASILEHVRAIYARDTAAPTPQSAPAQRPDDDAPSQARNRMRDGGFFRRPPSER